MLVIAVVMALPALSFAYPSNISHPIISISPDSPSGATTGAYSKLIMKFNVTATNFPFDPGENKVMFQKVNITTLLDGVIVNNLKVYPANYDLSETYATSCTPVSQSKWECNLNTAGGSNEIIEGTSVNFVVRADVGSSSNPQNTLWASIASLGNINVAGDVEWGDGVNTYNYIDQVPTQIMAPSPLIFFGSSGPLFYPNDTKPVFSVSLDNPSGVTTGAYSKIIMKFNVSATPNFIDPAENKVVFQKVDLTTQKSGVSVNNLKIYPANYDLNESYATVCSALNQMKWRCYLNKAGATNEIIEGTTVNFVVRADIGASANPNNALWTSIATLGNMNTSGDVNWSNGSNTYNYVDQVPTQIKGSGPLTLSSNSGNYDTTGPSITSVNIQGTSDNKFTNNDLVTIKWNEAIDPSRINPFLLPDGRFSVINVPAAEGYLARSVSFQSSVKIPGIFDKSIGGSGLIIGGNTFLNGSQDASIVWLRLSSNGKELTIKVANAGAVHGSTMAENFTSSIPTTAVMQDINFNSQLNTAVTPTGVF